MIAINQTSDHPQKQSSQRRQKPKKVAKETENSNTTDKIQLLSSNRRTTNTNKNSQQQTHRKQYEFPPLILEGTGLSRVALNKLLIDKMPEVKCNNIVYNDKTGNFTLYPTNVISFNMLLNQLPMNDLPSATKIFIPRSIQRIQKTDTEAFIKKVDKELMDDDIRHALIAEGYQVNQIERLMNKEKNESGTTIKITFSDVKNPDTFVRLGLKVDRMYFPVEKAQQKIVPQQCYICYRFGHIAKYCRQQHHYTCG
jgi:hypothetical protein